ncbi:class I SAM-dependent methyltransferase [Actinomycetospora endophytica]|uniref:Class I SAM-dependent methyltransferase n=1 Tax=Actinomycetospora endophytica TaxID=2291215 RepID=A0ABS8P6K3_9PSEU|nr:class I SAM-dependent methyltransferase [Actinomycetospora endophytica]MCD2193866.1 class I SAM-dependent methyltransferase [Actinomycetospora endophytica]
MTRAMTFGTRADAYDRLRPAPAPGALDQVLPPGVRRVADLAAGTGLVTRAVLARPGAPAVVAVEPDPRMLARLATTTPGALAVRGVAEAIPLASGSMDAVLASSAWHWFDPPVATAEIARVLRPGGVLGLLWSRADPTVPWVAQVRGIGNAAADGSARLSRRGFDVALPPGHGFVDELPEAVTVRWTRRMTRDDVAGMVCTYSGVLELPAAEQDEVRRAARELLDVVLPGTDDVDVPFETVARRWTRAG